MSTIPKQADIDAALNAYVYLDDTGSYNGETLQEIAKRLRADPKITGNAEKEGNLRILENILDNDSNICKLRLANQSGAMKGYEDVHACVFASDSGEAYMAFRGTGEGRWVDNGIGFGAEDSEIQKLAAQYYDKVCQDQGWIDGKTKIYLSGHSKGGNLAQYVTMNAKYRSSVENCISLDGQGFSPEALARMRTHPDYNEQLSKIWSVSGENDPVNQLGLKLVTEDHDIYVRQDAPQSPFDFHMHELRNMLDANGKINEISENGMGENGRMFRELSDIIMVYPPEMREDVAKGIMQIAEVAIGNVFKSTAYASNEDILGMIRIGVPTVALYLLCDNWDVIRKQGQPTEFLAKMAIAAMAVQLSYGITRENLQSMGIDYFSVMVQVKLEKIRAYIDTLLPHMKEEIAALTRRLANEIYNFAVNSINTLKQWYNEHFNRGYQAVQRNPYFRIDTGAYNSLGQRVEALYAKIRRIEDLLDTVYWFNVSLSIGEYHHVGNANRSVGSLSKVKQCASYFFKTAEQFDKIEKELGGK